MTESRRPAARCVRCEATLPDPTAAGWNVTTVAGRITGYLCPDCQTAEENAEAEINAATLDYGRDRTATRPVCRDCADRLHLPVSPAPLGSGTMPVLRLAGPGPVA